MENSALLKELWEGRRHHQELTLTLQRERQQAKALQLEYDQFRHQVKPFLILPSRPHLAPAVPPLRDSACLPHKPQLSLLGRSFGIHQPISHVSHGIHAWPCAHVSFFKFLHQLPVAVVKLRGQCV